MSKSPIPVYEAEVEAGLAQAIAQQNTLAYLAPVLHSPKNLKQQLLTAAVLEATQATLGSDITFDLYPIHTILVTTGWNNNDDVFLPQETWAARLTPEHKPFNVGHEPREIIGHITANVVVDDKLNIIDDNISFERVPEKFHILTSAVVYRHLNSRDDTLEAEAAELIKDIQDEKYFVSMECLFNNFDYGLTYSSGEQQLVPRNHTTAFLTKHLRIHGGVGSYNGGKLGRVLRNITFSGKGLVETPANPESVIFNDTQRFVGTVALDFSNEEISTSNELGEFDMAESDKYTGQLEEQTKSLQSDLAAANKRIEELGEATVKSALAEKDASIAKLEDEVKASQAKIEELTASFNDAVKAKETAEAEKAEVDTQLTDATAKLAEVEVTAQATARVSQMVDKGIDKAVAEEIVSTFADLDDEKFEKIVEMKATVAQASESDDSDNDDVDSSQADDNADPEGEAAAGDADLESAEADEDLALGSDDGEGQEDEMMTTLASYLDTTMHGEDNK
jgi:hypothetical protein